MCLLCGMCDCLFAVEPCVVVAISLATDYIFRGQLGAKKNEEGKKERKKKKKQLNPPCTIHTALCWNSLFYIPPFNVTFNIQQLPSVEDP